jgi:GNAT superfamily N-acetyltransferase
VKTLQSIQIQRADDNEFIEATIVRLSVDDARHLIDDIWWDLPDVPDEKLKKEGDNHWNWASIVLSYGVGVLRDCVAVKSKEGYIEGAVAYNFNAWSRLETNAGCAYIDRISTAPRNRRRLVSQPLYKGVGSALMYWVLKESYNAGLGGRIALESLPTPDTIRFYEAKGFERTDLSQPSDGLMDYELPKAKAEAWLKQEGDLSK